MVSNGKRGQGSSWSVTSAEEEEEVEEHHNVYFSQNVIRINTRNSKMYT
jgi:hypothetical protein